LAAFTAVAVLTVFTGGAFAAVFAALFAAFLTFAQRAFCARAILDLPSALITRLVGSMETSLEAVLPRP
jgi:hypothetical protein